MLVYPLAWTSRFYWIWWFCFCFLTFMGGHEPHRARCTSHVFVMWRPTLTLTFTIPLLHMISIYIYTGNRVQELRTAQSGSMVVTRPRDLFGARLSLGAWWSPVSGTYLEPVCNALRPSRNSSGFRLPVLEPLSTKNLKK
jgi:hypothetical protein